MRRTNSFPIRASEIKIMHLPCPALVLGPGALSRTDDTAATLHGGAILFFGVIRESAVAVARVGADHAVGDRICGGMGLLY